MKHIQKQPLSVICYILWYIYHQHEKTDLAFSVDPLRYIFRYENKYSLFGKDVWQLEKQIRWFKTNIVLMFEKQRWEEVIQRFDNFRSLETNKPTNSHNTYLTLNLRKEEYVSHLKDINDRIIKIPSPGFPTPKRYRPLSGGLAFGFLKNGTIICFAAAPHILNQKDFSFAILRGIETQSFQKRHGYALKTVSVLCKELFDRYDLSNIFLWVEEKNFAARNLYKKLGFKEEVKVFMTYCDRRD
jgi:hypothetical protein